MSKNAASNLASAYSQKALTHLRYRGYNENPMNQGLAINGERTVWYHVDKSTAINEEGATRLLAAVNTCFREEGLAPVSRVLMGAPLDKEFTLSFAFPNDNSDAVNAAVGKINEASRKMQQGMALGSQSV